MAPAHAAAVEGGRRRLDPRRIGKQRLQHRRLAETVAADQADLLAAVHDRAEVAHYLEIAERLVDALDFGGNAPRWAVHGEFDVGALDIGPRQLGRLQPLDFFLARHHLAGARAG